MSDEKRPLVIYHGGCRDGFCAAWVCSRFLEEAEFFAGYYGQPPPDCTGRHVYIVDFSYPLADMQAIAASAKTLKVLDHHKTAEEALRGFSGPNVTVFFDMDRSGATLAWDYFRPTEKRPMIVEYIEDRDLWRWKLPESRAVNAYLSTLPFDFAAWMAAETTAAQDCMEGYEAHYSAARAGRHVEAKTEQYVREMAKNARRVMFEGHEVPLVNAPQVDISELLDYLINHGECVSPIAIGWWQRADGVFQYSLRSRGDFDVSALAKKYGGGGHKNAAGFQSSTLLP